MCTCLGQNTHTPSEYVQCAPLACPSACAGSPPGSRYQECQCTRGAQRKSDNKPAAPAGPWCIGQMQVIVLYLLHLQCHGASVSSNSYVNQERSCQVQAPPGSR